MSPKVISSVAVASFSFTTGTAPEPEQRVEGVADVDVGLPVADVRGREQDLRRLNADTPERTLPGLLELRLADGRGSLELTHRRRPPREPEPGHAERDRTGGDDADGMAARQQVGHLLRPRGEQPAPHASLRRRDEAGAELDDDPHRRFIGAVPSPTTRYWRSHRSR